MDKKYDERDIKTDPDSVVFTERKFWNRLQNSDLRELEHYAITGALATDSGIILFLHKDSGYNYPRKVARFVPDEETGKVEVSILSLDREQMSRYELFMQIGYLPKFPETLFPDPEGGETE